MCSNRYKMLKFVKRFTVHHHAANCKIYTSTISPSAQTELTSLSLFKFCFAFSLSLFSSSSHSCPLTFESTCLHDRVSRVGLQPPRVPDPVDVDVGVARGLAQQQGVPVLLDHLHLGLAEDAGEAGRQAALC